MYAVVKSANLFDWFELERCVWTTNPRVGRDLIHFRLGGHSVCICGKFLSVLARSDSACECARSGSVLDQ